MPELPSVSERERREDIERLMTTQSEELKRHPKSDTIHDDARRVARWMMRDTEGDRHDFWDIDCYGYLKAVTLHVITSEKIPDAKRNLATVRDLAVNGDTETHFLLREAGEKNVPTAHQLLYAAMIENRALDHDIRKAGLKYLEMCDSAKEQFYGLVETVDMHTEFLLSRDSQ